MPKYNVSKCVLLQKYWISKKILNPSAVIAEKVVAWFFVQKRAKLSEIIFFSFFDWYWYYT